MMSRVWITSSWTGSRTGSNEVWTGSNGYSVTETAATEGEWSGNV